MSKPETTFITSVHKHVSAYKEKTNNPYRGGMPDVYYEGNSHLWIEYKFVIMPKRDTTLIQADLSALQSEWLRRCHLNTGRARVIVGCREGGVIMETPEEWDYPISVRDFQSKLLGRIALGAYIDALCLTSSLSSPPRKF